MRARSIFLGTAAVLSACQPLPPQLRSWPTVAEATRPSATLQLGVHWPHRAAQQIPLSAETIWVQVRKGSITLCSLPLRREDGAATASLLLPADTGLSVRADAFRAGQATTSPPVASAEATGVALRANQRTTVALDLRPQSVPRVTSFSPDNGGPGVMVKLSGSFGDQGPYALALGEARSTATREEGRLVAPVPVGATSGPLGVVVDGITGGGTATFRVLAHLLIASVPVPVLSVGETCAFSVPRALDTAGQVVLAPTVTRWEVLDPRRLSRPGSSASGIGSLEERGATCVFTATATGSAWIVAWSGALCATASVTVK